MDLEHTLAAQTRRHLWAIAQARGLSHRTVDPLRLEERRGVRYLVAYCHLRHAERLFRLDRIRAASVSSAGERES